MQLVVHFPGAVRVEPGSLFGQLTADVELPVADGLGELELPLGHRTLLQQLLLLLLGQEPSVLHDRRQELHNAARDLRNRHVSASAATG
ncbi:hypothetical protein B0E54_06093 [Micromonospora sp. MH99]|nr:hypothetical protein [Micromonospora sp. MH99]